MQVITGNYAASLESLESSDSLSDSLTTAFKSLVLKPGATLYAGAQCNDGRPITESFRYKKAKMMGIPIVHMEEEKKEKKEMFVEKYKPHTIQEIIGHKEQLNDLGKWLKEFPKVEKKGVLITGPPGIGKTTMAHLVSKAMGYKVAEYNASDTRSIHALKGLGFKRLFKEVVIMDEIDGLSERGGIGEIAELIRKTQIPIICIANDRPPKLKPIINVTLDIKCSRPMKITVATALAKKIPGTTKEQIERLCEESGNDIRSILNTLDFAQGAKERVLTTKKDKEDDIFSATFKLMRNKKLTFAEADDLVFTDFSMIPLMVQEAYAAASTDIDELAAAAERLSFGDVISKQVMTDWTLLPHVVSNTTAVTKMVTGFTPSQIFPSFLGKESKRSKHRGWCQDLAKRMDIPTKKMRLDYMGTIQTILMNWIMYKDKKDAVKEMTEMGIIREDLDTLHDLSMEKVEVPSKTKSALTREFTKLQGKALGKASGKRKVDEMEDEEELDETNEDELEMKELQL
jgi:replication factor C subunit 1